MNKIKKINIIFVHHDRYHESIDLPFLDWIYTQCNSKDIMTIWFDHRHCNCGFWNLYYRTTEHEKFLFL